MCVIDSGNVSEVWVENYRTARKHHLCSACFRVIRPGQTYLYNFNVFEGNTSHSKACLDCEEIMGRFGKAHGMYFAPCDIGHQLSECVSHSDEYDEGEDSQWRQDLDFIRLGRWLYRFNKFNRTISSEETCRS